MSNIHTANMQNAWQWEVLIPMVFVSQGANLCCAWFESQSCYWLSHNYCVCVSTPWPIVLYRLAGHVSKATVHA